MVRSSRLSAFIVALAVMPATAYAVARPDDGAAMTTTAAGQTPSAASPNLVQDAIVGGSARLYRLGAAGSLPVEQAGVGSTISAVRLMRSDDTPTDAIHQVSAKISRLPEPTTWAMMIAGFALAALVLRRRLRVSEQRFTERLRRIAEGEEA